MDKQKLKQNYETIMNNIEKACKKSGNSLEDINVVCVTKYVDIETVKQVLDLGIKNIGENKIQQLDERRNELEEFDVNWHMIGNLQSNKIKYIADYIKMIHSVNRKKIVKYINKFAEKSNRIIDCFIEINVSEEETKQGADINNINEIFDYYVNQKFDNINIVGLMTMAPYTENETQLHNCFSKLRKFKDDLNQRFSLKMNSLSMGMSNDYEIAVEEGATHLRIGSAFFK